MEWDVVDIGLVRLAVEVSWIVRLRQPAFPYVVIFSGCIQPEATQRAASSPLFVIPWRNLSLSLSRVIAFFLLFPGINFLSLLLRSLVMGLLLDCSICHSIRVLTVRTNVQCSRPHFVPGVAYFSVSQLAGAHHERRGDVVGQTRTPCVRGLSSPKDLSKA